MFLTQSVVFQHHNFEILEDFDPPKKTGPEKIRTKSTQTAMLLYHRFLSCFTFGCFPKSNKTNFYFFPKNPHEKHEKKHPNSFSKNDLQETHPFISSLLTRPVTTYVHPPAQLRAASAPQASENNHRWLGWGMKSDTVIVGIMINHYESL